MATLPTAAEIARKLHLREVNKEQEHHERARLERELGRDLPPSVDAFIRFPELTAVMAEAYEAHPIFPEHARLIDGRYVTPDRGPVLLLFYENQGVCAWGVPCATESESAVLVGEKRAGEPPQVSSYATTVDAFARAWIWDRRVLHTRCTLMAQADPLDAGDLAQLRAMYQELEPSFGWPGRRNLRFEGDGDFAIALWDGRGQCDWWIVSPEAPLLKSQLPKLRRLSNLERALWSNDECGMELLRRMGLRGPWAE
jgi:hypothetical protein